MIQFFTRFIPNLQPMCAPLYHLLQKGAKREWSAKDKNIFRKVKPQNHFLAHYDEKLSLIVVMCEACKTGIGASLMHRYPDGTERPIAFASQTLSKSEQKWSFIDREALVLIFAVTCFH